MTFPSRRWRRSGLAVAAALGLTAVGASAYADIPDPDGLIHGCYNTRVGLLRVIDPATSACQSTETPISWNQTGPQGPKGDQGAPGPQGVKGDKGDPGSSHLYLTRSDEVTGGVHIFTTSDEIVLSQPLPAGTYLVQARVVALSFSFDHKQVLGRCALYHGGVEADDDIFFTVPGLPPDAVETDPPQSNIETLQAAITLTAPATLSLTCRKQRDAAPDYIVHNNSLSALQVSALN